MKERQQPAVFGKRKEPHTVIIARGDKVRHFTVRPWAVVAGGILLCAISAGYLLATSYLFFRDDLISAAVTREAYLRQSYEDRIATLRAELDRVTSRQLLDQQVVEKKVAELLRRQNEISQRHSAIEPMLRTGSETPPLPTPRPDKPADRQADASDLMLRGSGDAPVALTAYAAAPEAPSVPWPLRNEQQEAGEDGTDPADAMLATVGQSLERIEAQQVDRIDALTETTHQAASDIADALQAAGLSADVQTAGTDDVGGPYLPVGREATFYDRIEELDEALGRLDSLQKVARSLPLRNPAPGKPVTSRFGVRHDPFLRKPAFHSGMDFRAPYGSIVRATAPGTVTTAGWAGGYGRLVEIDNGGGITTRFGHLGSIDVTVGQKVSTGTVLGKSGSSGRSTGPHLHYEIRKNGQPLDPLAFLKAGRKISRYL